MKRTNAAVRAENIRSYESAWSVAMKQGERSICHNTHLREVLEADGTTSIQVIFHKTPIVTFYPNGVIRLSTGGWQTVTTKQRLNMFSPYPIYSEKREWLIRLPSGTFPFTEDDSSSCFGSDKLGRRSQVA